MYLSRRSLLIAAPAVILTPRLLMPVRSWRLPAFRYSVKFDDMPPPVAPMRRFLSDGGRLYEYVDWEMNWREIEWQPA